MDSQLKSFIRICRTFLTNESGHKLLIFIIFAFFSTHSSTGLAAYQQKMRPYTGIGLIVFSGRHSHENINLQLKLYEEPGLLRVGILNTTRLSANEWVFTLKEEPQPLIVSARKGDWFQIFYDNAGRKAWIKPDHNVEFQTWEHFLKLHTGYLLPGLQPHFYQMQQRPDGKLLNVMTSKQPFKVLKLEDDWVMVLSVQGQMGWLRWRDVDGRITLGVGKN